MTASGAHRPYRRTLARRITIGVVSAVVFASLLRLVLHLHVNYREEAAKVARSIEQHAVVQRDALRNALWMIDEVQTQSLLDGLVDSTDVRYAEIASDGEVLYSAGQRHGERAVVVTLELARKHHKQAVELGKLTVVGRAVGLLSYIREHLIPMLLISVLEVVIVIALLLVLIKRFVVDPIEQMAHDAGKVAEGGRDVELASLAFTSRHDDGELAYLASSIHRMTAQLLDHQELLERRVKTRTEMLSRSNRDLVQAQQLARMGSWVCRADGVCSHWSRQLFRILEYQPSDDPSVGLMLDRVHPDDRADLSRLIAACHESQRPFERELRLLLPDGRAGHARVIGEYEDTGLVRGVLIDMTLEYQTREKLRLASVIIESTAEGTIITDADVRIEFVNPGFTRITGYTLDDVRGQNPSMLSSGRHDTSFYQDMWRVLVEDGHWHGDIWNRRKTGEIYPQWLSISAIKTAGEITHYVGVLSDISTIRESQEHLHYLAHHDALTGLPNRLMLMSELDNAIKRARRHDQMLAVLFLDLVGFKSVNDTRGHLAGDELLRAVAERLGDTVREADLLARLGGDEFIVLLEDLNDADQAAGVAKKVIDAFARPFDVHDSPLMLSVSIGISLFPDDARDPVGLMNLADTAMYWAKRESDTGYCLYAQTAQQADGQSAD